MSQRAYASFKVDLTQSRQTWDRKTKYKRGLWQFIVKPIYWLLPGKRNRLRVPILRAMGAQIGKDVFIQQRVNILMPWELELGDCLAIAHDVTILNFCKVEIQSMTVVSQHAHLCTGSHDYTHPHFPLVFKPITIASEAWVASGAFIGAGVTVGHGSVIGANAVVTKDMPAWKVCAGNPCRPLKDREIRN